MVVVAVAGGTGHLGRTIVEVLKENPNHKVIVLARKAPEVNDPSAPVFAVDYADIEGTAKVLADAGVETVISTIAVADEATSVAQVGLVQSAAKSAHTKRFIASDWGVKHSPASHRYALREAAFAELRKTDLEWTRFVNGWFLDFYAPPDLKSYIRGVAFAVDVASKTAGIPGTGDEPVVLTYSFDLAKFVDAFLDLPKWEEVTYCYGERTTWNTVVSLAEEARGAKFNVTYDSLEKLQKGQITELPAHSRIYPLFPKPALQGFLALMGGYVLEGRIDVPVDESLNVVFLDIQTMTVKETMELWRGK